MFHWLHHLINPHCPFCEEAAQENKICQSCETLKLQLSIANHEKQELLNTILAISKPTTERQTPEAVDYEKIKPRLMTWNVRKQLLEAEDRKAAQLIADRAKENKTPIAEQIANLEKEVGIEEGVK